MIPRSIFMLVLVSVATLPALGQGETVADTLDWTAYLPLQVGNAWEWTTWILVDYRAQDRHEVLSDTLIDGIPYYVLQRIHSETEFGIHSSRADSVLLRYDENAGGIRVRSLTGQEGWLHTCSLATEFGSTIDCGATLGVLNVVGGYAAGAECLTIGSDCMPYPAMKGFFTLGGGATFYHGIGVVPAVGDGSQGSIDMTYARISGVEYGESAVRLGVPRTPRPDGPSITVYPNPASDHVVIASEGYVVVEALRVFDALGRRVRPNGACHATPCRLDLDGLEPGLYLVHIEAASLPPTAQRFVVMR